MRRPRVNPTLKANVLTTGLILIAANAVIISFLFSINEVDIPIKSTTEWVLHKLYKVIVFKLYFMYLTLFVLDKLYKNYR